jgi:hypothetical protein
VSFLVALRSVTDRYGHDRHHDARDEPPSQMMELLVAANKMPRWSAHSSRTGQPCKKAAITGMRVCRTHGQAAPQVREAARLRLALLADPAVRRLAKIIKHGEDAQALAAIKVVLERNEL